MTEIEQGMLPLEAILVLVVARVQSQKSLWMRNGVETSSSHTELVNSQSNSDGVDIYNDCL